MTVTKALAAYIDSVDKHIADYGDPYPVSRRAGCELRFVKFCAHRDVDPAEVASFIVRAARNDADLPVNILWLEGAWSYICYTQ